MLRVKNTLTGELEEFIPIHEKKVGIYVCGLTVYDRMHIGHMRSMISFDIIIRYLRAKGYDVVFVRNFTDVDDKIIQRAKQEGITPFDVAEKYIEEFRKDISHFELLKPNHEPRVTENIDVIVELIRRIVERGHAYISDGDVYFSVDSFPEYGKLSRMPKEKMLAGARVEPSEKKKNPLDFALWKSPKEEIEPRWPSPWGEGRPGWHIECSAMSMKFLGETFDIHGGGQDLIFPHHENEIAQSESATGKQFVKYWLHSGHLKIKGEKMSKSLGNVVGIPELITKFHPEVIKFFIAKHHYRSPIDFSEEELKKDEKTLVNFYYTLEIEIEKSGISEEDVRKAEVPMSLREEFEKIMDDDFNTPSAFSFLFSYFDRVRKEKRKEELIQFLSFLRWFSEITGVFGRVWVISSRSFIQEEVLRRCEKAGISHDELEKLIRKREEFRKMRNFEEADKIRKKILDIGIRLLDTPFGTKKIPE